MASRSMRRPPTSPKASGSSSPSPVRSWPTSPSSSSTRRHRTSIPVPRSLSSAPWTGSCTGARRSSSHTGSPPSGTQTSSSSWMVAISSKRAPTRSFSRKTVSTRASTTPSSRSPRKRVRCPSAHLRYTLMDYVASDYVQGSRGEHYGRTHPRHAQGLE